MAGDASSSSAAGPTSAPAPATAALVEDGDSSRPVAFAAFLSHAKADAAMEARYLQTEFEASLGQQCFLDSDDLRDLLGLTQHVCESKVRTSLDE